jgi:hypothetical protein
MLVLRLGADASTPQGTVSDLPIEGKNFLQPTFLVVLGSSSGIASVSIVSSLSSQAVEMVEFSSSISAAEAKTVITARNTMAKERIILAMVSSVD